MSNPSKPLYHSSSHHHPSSSSVPDSYMMTSNHVGGNNYNHALHHSHQSYQLSHKNNNNSNNHGGVRGTPPNSSNNNSINVQTSSSTYHQPQQNTQPFHYNQPWRPMAPNNVAKIRYPPPPPPPPPNNGREYSTTSAYRGSSSINHYSLSHSGNHLPPSNSNNNNNYHIISSPPSSSTTSSLMERPLTSGVYGQQSSSGYSSSYGSHHQPIQYNSQHPQQTTAGVNRRILTNLNASQSVNRRLDMSPESHKDAHHRTASSNHGGGGIDLSNSSSRMTGHNINNNSSSSGVNNNHGSNIISAGSSKDNKTNNRRRSSGTGQLAIKRSDQAPVTLKGWLYKQGSDGLMLWKKRWFVLSEFCLFYYKSSEEDKVSGSILLPSYKISPVIKEDGVVYHRKFSFKAEHHNMRTYFFAAETKESMIQWMNALSLASILQQHQELKMNPPVLLPPSSNPPQQQRNYVLKHQQQPQQGTQSTPLTHNVHNYNNNNSVKVIQHHPPAVYQMFNSNGTAYVPAAALNTSNNNNNTPSSSNQRYNSSNNGSFISPGEMDGGIQPLYANAPPKPARRLNSSRDYSPDSDSENGIMNSSTHHTLYQSQQQQYNNNPPSSTSYRLPHERRTPEAYARSQNHHQHAAAMFRGGDYEDPSLNQRILQFPNYRAPNLQQQQQQQHIRDNNNDHHRRGGENEFSNKAGYQREFSPSKHRRPHSADFLEYDRSMIRSTQDDQVIINSRRRSGGASQPPRPKSSIDQPRMFKNEEEFHLWTEESYAQKMREQQMILQSQQQLQQPAFSTHPNSRSQSRMSFARESSYNDSEAEVEKYFPTPMPRTPKNNSYNTHSSQGNQYQNLPLSSSSAVVNHRSEGMRLEAITPNRLSEMGIMGSNNDPDEEGGELQRSSSARLPRQRRSQTSESEDPRKKEQEITKLFFQREESMKRLLEWKQRMLQSPLTRKSSRNASRTQTPTNSTSPIPSSSSFVFPSSSHDYIKQRVLEEFDKQDVPSSSISGGAGHARTLPSHNSSEKRLSRKGSSGSRSSRSRSSPRFGSRRDLSSSDENEPPCEARLSRRRKSSSSSQIRSRASSKDSKKSSSSGVAKRGSYTEIMAQVVEQQQIHDQPEYININSLEETLSKQRNGGELSVVQRLNDKARVRPQYIGPDDWYKDDFDYDKFHSSSFLQDPLLNRQYGMLLSDMKRSEEADLEVQLVKRPSLGQCSSKDEEDSMKYPDSAYETMTFRVNNGNRGGQEAKEESFRSNSFSLEDINEALDDETTTSSGGKAVGDKRKRSVKELLSDFERKSKEVMLKESEALAEMGNANRRRVCSDTETLLYDDDTSSDEAPPLPLKSVPPIEQEYLPMLNKKQEESPFSPFGNIVQSEDSHYVAMIPAKPPPLHTSHRNKSYPLLPPCDPEERVLHSRTPSQTLVMEHLQKEMSQSQQFLLQAIPPPPPVEEDTYVDMNDDGTVRGVGNDLTKKKKKPILAPLESPRYCEIDESQVVSRPSQQHEFPKSSEVLYHEIPEEHKSPLRPIEGLPDILGNSSNNNSNNESKNRRESLVSSSDQDSLRRRSSLAEESTRRSTSSSVFSESTERRHSRSSVFSNDSTGADNRSRGSISQLNMSDTFKPASFFLDHREKSLTLSKKTHHHSSSSSSSLRDRELPKTPDQRLSTSHEERSGLPSPPTAPTAGTPNFTGFSFNLTYRSVYDTEGEATASTTEEDKESDKDDAKRLENLPPAPPPVPPPKVPYYVSDIVHGEGGKREEEMISMNPTLPAKSRRSKTPEHHLDIQGKEAPSIYTNTSENNILDDEDNDEVFLTRTSDPRSQFKPARGVDPPPPPEGIPPLDISRISSKESQHHRQKSDDDYYWRENLRKASAQVISPPPTAMAESQDQHHINGYIWDERSQRFYKLSNHPSSKTQEQLKSQTFLGEGLPGTFSTNDKGRQIISCTKKTGEEEEDLCDSETQNLEPQGKHQHQLIYNPW